MHFLCVMKLHLYMVLSVSFIKFVLLQFLICGTFDTQSHLQMKFKWKLSCTPMNLPSVPSSTSFAALGFALISLRADRPRERKTLDFGKYSRGHHSIRHVGVYVSWVKDFFKCLDILPSSVRDFKTWEET